MSPLPLALTMGEPAGIGGEIALKAWLSKNRPLPPFFVIDDPARLRQLAMQLRLDVPVIEIAVPKAAIGAFANGLPVLPHPLAERPVPGKPSPANAVAVTGAIERGPEFDFFGDGQCRLDGVAMAEVGDTRAMRCGVITDIGSIP